MNAMTLEQMEKQKQEYHQYNQQQQQINNNNQISAPSGNNGGGGFSGGNIPTRTWPPTAHDEVPGYYQTKLGGTTRPTRMPTRRPTNKPSMSAEQAMHRYSFCGAFWTDVSVFCTECECCVCSYALGVINLTYQLVIHHTNNIKQTMEQNSTNTGKR